MADLLFSRCKKRPAHTESVRGNTDNRRMTTRAVPSHTQFLLHVAQLYLFLVTHWNVEMSRYISHCMLYCKQSVLGFRLYVILCKGNDSNLTCLS